MTARTVDALLDERARLVAKNAATEGHLWAAEFLLHRIKKIFPHLIADSAYSGVVRDTLATEIDELLSEDRPHPGFPLDLPDGSGDGEVPLPSGEGVA